MNRLCYIGLIFVALVSCNKTKLSNRIEKSGLFENAQLTLKEAINFEKQIDSKDISYDHYVEIDEGFYPNKQKYNLTSVKTFLRADTNMNYSINYWSSSDDSIRAVLYEWNRQYVSQQNDTASMNVDQSSPQLFDAKFIELEKSISSVLGKPTLKNINPILSEETQRDDIKWVSPNSLNVYLLMFKDRGGYREIRMATYIK
ncbi:MAG TPA: hypothetical protein PKA77_17880 [Chitinophagaceae bacterium]|jgi:hypothetical protein|nr:hypothetical protein [Chitinophagaceae bacterium]